MKLRQFAVLIATICGALLLACVNSAQADNLRPGGYFFWEYTVRANTEYQIAFDYHAETCSNMTTEGSCCALLVNYSSRPPSLMFAEEVITSPQSENVLAFFHAKKNQTISLAMYGLGECNYSPPQVTPLPITHWVQWTGVNAQSGQMLYLPTIASTEANPRHFLRDLSWRDQLTLPNNPHQGKMAADAAIETRAYIGYKNWVNDDGIFTQLKPLREFTQASPEQAELADAQYHSGLVYQYLLTHLGLNGFDNQGSSMRALVNEPYPLKPEYFCDQLIPANAFLNAFWDGAQMNFTPRITGDSVIPPKSLTAALDIIAHEWGHGVMQYGADLQYERESGALNEAYSDWLGMAVKFANGDTNWVLGSGVLPQRSLESPQQFAQPDIYKGLNWQDTSVQACPTPTECNDACGIHQNSGVPNKMFYLLSQGGVFNGVAVGGLGIETAIKIATDAVRYYWSANENFVTARAGMEAAAATYGANAVTQVSLAWRAVGVLNDSEMATPKPPTVTPDTPTAGGKSSSKSGGALDAYFLIILGLFLALQMQSTAAPKRTNP